MTRDQGEGREAGRASREASAAAVRVAVRERAQSKYSRVLGVNLRRGLRKASDQETKRKDEPNRAGVGVCGVMQGAGDQASRVSLIITGCSCTIVSPSLSTLGALPPVPTLPPRRLRCSPRATPRPYPESYAVANMSGAASAPSAAACRFYTTS